MDVVKCAGRVFLFLEKDAPMNNKIKIERTSLDLTQEKLAFKIGVSRQTINSIEKNIYVPSTVLALKLSRTFNKPVNDFFELEDSD